MHDRVIESRSRSTHSRILALGPVALLAVLVAGCTAGASGTDVPAASTATPNGSPAPSAGASASMVPRPSRSGGRPIATIPPSAGRVVTGEVPSSIVATIVTDAASWLAVDPAALEVISGEQVIWNNGSLGCPKPGMVYTQALVPGYRVLVSTGSAELDYRATDAGSFVLCESPSR